jgi:hypothetical protein
MPLDDGKPLGAPAIGGPAEQFLGYSEMAAGVAEGPALALDGSTTVTIEALTIAAD